jgi:TPP-dependent pyruvate/acetoin dehydrogenase alpha subunit
MALGAALALKAQGRQGVVIAYVRKDELSRAAYAKMLKPAAKNELPVIFVVLPRLSGRKAGDDVAKIAKVAGKSGVPGIPVDACDAVALYRVTQESLGRARGGDGPVLVECVTWRAEGGRGPAATTDPLEHLKNFLLGRKVSTPAWFKQVEVDARRRLRTKRTASKRT